MKDYAKADSVLEVAEDVVGQIFGNASREVADNKEYRVEIEMIGGGDSQKVLGWLREAGAGRRQLIDLALPRASGRELESLVGAFQGHYELSCYAAERYGLGELAYDNALYFKNLSLNTLSALRQEIMRSDDVLCKQRFEEWTRLQSVLATELASPAASRGNTDSLQQALNLIERELSALVGDVFGKARPGSRWREVQASLRRGEAAVEFVAYRPPVLAGKREKRYGAAVLRPGDAEPHFVFLFEERELLSLLERVEESPSALYTRGGRVLDSRPVYGEELYRMLWQPLEHYLGGARTVYYVPDGLLHQIAFDALPVGRKGILADRCDLRRLSSTGRAGREEVSPDFRTAAVLGGAAYDESTEEAQDTLLPADPGAQLWVVAERPRGYFEDGFDYLPGTEQEVGQLHQLFTQKGLSSHLYTREEVSETAIKALGEAGGESPDILHIATHGFYFPPPERGGKLGKNAFYWHENPLFRSGLVLAGANKAWRGEGEGSASTDGILTAYEISGLDLSRTRLVALSACETGLGDLRGAEGVYGLRRAFKMAGAGTLLVSLWPAPDRETPEFMGYFYRHLLGGKPIDQAFRKAQRKMRRQHPDVVKWGCWVLVE
jgi:CHAT domain-containing protein